MLWTRSGLRIGLASALTGLFAAIALICSPGNAFAAGCTESWTNAAGGAWNVASNWNTDRVPTSTDEVCIDLAGSYTVTLATSTSIGSLTLGTSSGTTTQTLAVETSLGALSLSLAADSVIAKTGRLELNSLAGGGYSMLNGVGLLNEGALETQVEGAGPVYLRTTVENSPSGKIEVQSGELRQDQGTTTTNKGTITVGSLGAFDLTSGSGKFVNEGDVADSGSIALTSATWTQSGQETGNAVELHGAPLIDSTGSGRFKLFGGCTLSGTISAEQTLTVTGTPATGAGTANLTGAAVTNDGTLILDSQKEGGYAMLEGSSLVNHGTLQAQVESKEPDYLRVDLENDTGGTVEVRSGELRQDEGTATTNGEGGAVTVDAEALFNLTSGAGELVNDGTLTNNGSISVTSATWTQAGEVTGNAIALHGATLIDSSGGGGGQFTLVGGCTLSGTIPAPQTITVTGTSAGVGVANLTGTSVTNDGKLVLDSQAAGGYAMLEGSSLVNHGTLQAQVESKEPDYLRVDLENDTGGTVEVRSGELRQDEGTTTTNSSGRTITVDPEALFSLTSGSGKLINDGTVANSGSISLTSAQWTQAGDVTGIAIELHGAPLIDESGSGQFMLFGGCTLSGTIPAEQTITVTGMPSTDVGITNLAHAAVINDGTLILDAKGTYAMLEGETLINHGTIQAQATGSEPDYLRVDVENEADGRVEAQSGELRQDEGTMTTNHGTFAVDTGGTLSLTSGSGSFVNDGTVANDGSISVTSAPWTQAGDVTGHSVALDGAPLIDSSGAGSFLLLGESKLSGTIPTEQTIAITGASTTGVGITDLVGSAVTNDGTLILAGQTEGDYAMLEGSQLINNGTLQSESKELSYLRADVENSLTGTIDVQSGELRQDEATTTNNEGTITIGSAGKIDLTSGSAIFSNQSTGTLAFDIASDTSFGTINFTSGATLQLLGGIADPILAPGYDPPVGTEYEAIKGVDTGTFTSVLNQFEGDYSHSTYLGLVRGSPPTQVVNPPATEATKPAGSVEARSGVLAFTAVAPPSPKLAATGNVALVSGEVTVQLPGTHTPVALAALQQIPFGTIIEATHGTVSVTTALPNGHTQTGQFFDGQFELTQAKNGRVLATLTGGNFAVCKHQGRAASASQAHASSGQAPGKHVVRKLWANAHGSFSTKGNYAAGAVQGTEWLTEDLCEGTLIRVTRDKVKVTDLVRHHNIEVKTGHQYLAKAPR